ncbi:MAG: PP0621 family protein [Nitrososphaera sp.]
MLAIRLLILLLLAYLVFLIINILFSSSRTTRLKRNRNPLDKGEELVLCLQCQSYVPKAEAVSSHGNYFCREECARLFMRTA